MFAAMQNTQELANAPTFKISTSNLPPILTAGGINSLVAPISRTLLYELAARGEIETVSLGLGRGKRAYLTASVVAWIERRAAVTIRPNIAPRSAKSGPALLAKGAVKVSAPTPPTESRTV